MFGIWRFILAMLVVVGHLWGFWFAASHAVFSFYVLSGFLMTLVLNEKYGFSGTGFRSFWIARLSRLLPTYWVGCALTIGLILMLSVEVTSAFNAKLTWPETPFQLLANATMAGLIHPRADLGLVPDQFPTLVPPAWALSIELFFYLCLSVYFARTLMRSFVLLGLGVLYVGAVFVLNPNFYWLYFFFPAAAIPFATGAILYFLLQRDRVRALFQPRAALAVVLFLYLSLYLVANWAPALGLNRAFILYLNIGTSALLIACLYTLKADRPARKLDAFFGDLSFPVYILHWQVGLLIASLLNLEKGTVTLFLASVPLILAFSVLDRAYVSGPVERRRRQQQ
ncbi:MAG: hypothetical protein BM562_04930 [Alphaproteobacteria bacterium MedPE-SWcel]|nr:MAG: hypothetical protein BM562_04930 [Alphaproteobacteria bacterium MedPE-SWcel]